MSKQDDGGQAFPGERTLLRAGYATSEREPVAGMTLRDYFAAKAMQALLTKMENMDNVTRLRLEALAHSSYMVADAMLRAG
jgi:hypothetical protein